MITIDKGLTNVSKNYQNENGLPSTVVPNIYNNHNIISATSCYSKRVVNLSRCHTKGMLGWHHSDVPFFPYATEYRIALSYLHRLYFRVSVILKEDLAGLVSTMLSSGFTTKI